MSLTQDCPSPLIDSTTLQQHWYTQYQPLVSLSQQRTARESSETHHSTQWHEYALPRLPEIYQKPPKQGHLFTEDTLDGPHYRLRFNSSYFAKYPLVTSMEFVAILINTTVPSQHSSFFMTQLRIPGMLQCFPCSLVISKKCATINQSDHRGENLSE